MKSNGADQRTLAVCFGQFGPYHHARVVALRRAAAEQGVRVVPVQIANATSTYEWIQGGESRVTGNRCDGLRTLCEGVEEAASPLDVFLKARKLFREVDVAFLPSYSPARYFALFAAAKSLGIRMVMMNESHAGTEQANGWKRWLKRQIVKRFDAALVGGEPHKRHFASLGIPSEKIFTGYDAVDNDFFASRADEIRAEARKSDVWRVANDELGEQEEKAGEVRSMEHALRLGEPTGRRGAGSGEQERPEAAHLSTLNPKPSTEQSLRSAYGLPERYFLSLGRMVEKKNLATLVSAYAKFCDGRRVSSDESGRQELVGLVFVGSGELEGELREQARRLGLRVVDRIDWKAGQSSHGLTRINTDGSERLTADWTGGDASCRVTPALADSPREKPDDCKLNTDDSAAQRGTVYFYGFRQIEENPVFYALAEAFVLPSSKEEWGLVVNEAMACSLPVIVSRTAGCAEDLLPGSESWQRSVNSIQSGDDSGLLNPQLSTLNSLEECSNGFVFDPSSSDALSMALRRIADYGTTGLQDDGTRTLAQMGRRSREIVAKFSCENFARQALGAAEEASTCSR